MLALVQRGLLRVTFRLEEELSAVQRLMAKYHDVPASLADPCLVRMAEQRADNAVLTLDSDFRIYRRNGRQVVYDLHDDHVAHLLDEAISHVEHVQLGLAGRTRQPDTTRVGA